MPGNRKPQRSGGHSNSSNSAADKAAEGMRLVKIESNDDNGGVDDKLGNFPNRPGEPDCIYYLRTGTCGYGSNCRFNHPVNSGGQVNGVKNVGELPERVGQPDCGYYLKTGTCKYGSTCKYHHPKDRQTDNQSKDSSQADSLVVLNVLGLPMRQDGKPCPYYMRTGSCKYGYACKFHHPQPASAANILPVVGPIYGSGGPAAAPSSSAPSTGELSSASLLKPAYFPGSSGPLPQNYVPIILSPSQGWNYYAGSASPSSVSGVLTAPASNGQVSVSNLPERPDQPECRHFMNHGSCKYGSECKYHHPREKIAQLAPSSIGPLGLPIRPGHSVCSYFSLYGICKYGPTCKFNHPMDGYYAYGLSIPPIAASYSSPSPYQSTSSFVPSSEISPTKSSKVSDWIKKGATVSSSSIKNCHPNTESVGDSADVVDSQSKAPSEVTHNESD